MSDALYLWQSLSMDRRARVWERLPAWLKDKLRDKSDLSHQLVGLEGRRVEVVHLDGRKERFRVGCSTGWRPCHLVLRNTRSTGGIPADKGYRSVRAIP